MKDVRGTMLSIGNRVCIQEDIPSVKKVVDNYVDNPSDISGSVVNIHQNSPFLDSNENNEPQFSGSRWKHIIKSK